MFFRIAVITAFCALLLAPVWVANDGVDRLFASQDDAPSAVAPSSGLAMSGALPGVGEDVLSRLRDVRTEIRADICRRGDKRYCLGGLCLPAQSCVRS